MITVPPVLVCVLILTLALSRDDIFYHPLDIILSLVFLGIFPVLAYPLQPFLPFFKENGRAGQRKLAFILNIIGYTLAFVSGLFLHVNSRLMLIDMTYFFSVVLLTILNLLHIRTSGHACSATGPLVLLIYFTGATTIIPCLIIMFLIVWSSLVLKRHTVKDLIFGIFTCIAAFLLAVCLI